MKPTIQETDTGYLVVLPVEDGIVKVGFMDMEQTKSHQLDADVIVWQQIAGGLEEPFAARMNILSLSNRESYRRNLDDHFGKGGWTAVVNRACGMVKAEWQNRDFGECFNDIPDPGPLSYTAKPWILDGLPTILFGMGGSGKTMMALGIARSIACGAWMLGEHFKEANVLYVDYESTGATLKRRLLSMGEIPDTMHYWPAKGIPLSDQLKAIERKVQRSSIGVVVVDSAAFACGGNALDQPVATRYFNALSNLGVTSLTVAHVTKAEEDKYPFGSVFWHNGARITWNVKASQLDDGLHLGLFNRKGNEDRELPPRGIHISFNGAVSFHPEELSSDFETHLPIGKRIRRLLLKEGKLGVKEIASTLDAKENTVYYALKRMDDAMCESFGRGRESQWCLIASDMSNDNGSSVK